MKILWCWRCRMDLPMLDDEEYRLVQSKVRLSDPEPFKDALSEFNRLTGFAETNINAVWHHRASDFGPPCPQCGKVLRTPVASKCFECGYPGRQPG